MCGSSPLPSPPPSYWGKEVIIKYNKKLCLEARMKLSNIVSYSLPTPNIGLPKGDTALQIHL